MIFNRSNKANPILRQERIVEFLIIRDGKTLSLTKYIQEEPHTVSTWRFTICVKSECWALLISQVSWESIRTDVETNEAFAFILVKVSLLLWKQRGQMSLIGFAEVIIEMRKSDKMEDNWEKSHTEDALHLVDWYCDCQESAQYYWGDMQDLDLDRRNKSL